MRNYRTTSHTKYDLKIHVVFIPKYRKKVLYGEVGEGIRDIIKEICTQNDIEIISGKLAIDHIHLFLSYPPYMSVSEVMQKIKGKSAYKIFGRYPNLKKIFWGRHFWARGYLAVSSGNITDEAIQKYIEEQEGTRINQGAID